MDPTPIKVVITGCVAVGKSSVVQDLQEHLLERGEDVCVVQEYIDKLADGQEMLERFLKGDITAFEFQSYILNYYRNALTLLNTQQTPTITIFERTVDDTVEIFGESLCSKGQLKPGQLEALRLMAKSIDTTFDLPSYFNNESLFVALETTNTTDTTRMILDIIQASRLTRVRKIVVGLCNTDSVCYQRMLKRARPGEQEGYTLEDISELNNAYMHLYTKIGNQRGENL